MLYEFCVNIVTLCEWCVSGVGVLCECCVSVVVCCVRVLRVF